MSTVQNQKNRLHAPDDLEHSWSLPSSSSRLHDAPEDLHWRNRLGGRKNLWSILEEGRSGRALLLDEHRLVIRHDVHALHQCMVLIRIPKRLVETE